MASAGSTTRSKNNDVQPNGLATEDGAISGILRALQHPIRRRILDEMAKRGDPVSPKDLAELLGEPLATVAYHFRILADHDSIELAETRPRRGAVQHFYRPSIDWSAERQGGELVIRVRTAEHRRSA
jgi:DNA-binding transcriptional ArsR family regulator